MEGVMMRRAFLAVLVGVIGVSPAVAVDAEADRPYDFQVILRVAPHGVLTSTFRRQLQSDLQDNLQAAFGTLAVVEVRDASAPPHDGWLAPTTLDRPQPPNPAKRHFVEVSYANGQYVVQARQLDGSTGLASPVIREDRTADRPFVSRLITRLIDQDFGAVGTVVRKENDRVWLRLRGSAVPGADVARWVPKGSVFTVARVDGDPPRGRPVEAALLQSVGEPKGGEVECQFYYRYRDAQKRDPIHAAPGATFRAIRLGTGSAPVRLRVLDANDLPVTDAQVVASPNGFDSADANRDRLSGREGLYESARPYDHVAFVNVSDGDTRARLPVPILDDRVLTMKFDRKSGGEARRSVEISVRGLHGLLLDVLNRMNDQNRELSALTQAGQNKEAQAKLQTTLEQLDARSANLAGEVSRLQTDAQKAGVGAGPTLAALKDCEVILKEIQKRRETWVQFQDELTKAIEAENSPEAKRQRDAYLALLRKAESLFEEADYEGAIATYKEILSKFNDRATIRQRLDELERAWQPIKDQAHHDARTFAYGQWAAIKTVDDLRDALPKAREAFKACQAARDKLTARKLFLVAIDKATSILSDSQPDEDKDTREMVQKLIAQLRELTKDLSTFLQEGEAEKK
jgi:tetratricopeptide (TPR) repeat protein